MSLKAFAVMAILSQATLRSPLRIGDVAQQLSADDAADVARIVSAGGANPWLLNGDRGMIVALEYVEAYLPPTLATRELRRGSFVTVVRGPADALAIVGLRPAESRPMGWMTVKTESYAQVAVAGRAFDEIQGEHDVNRPFRVVGTFDDSELVSLAGFVRSSPTAPDLGRGAVRVRGEWPIAAVVRETDEVDVRLRKDRVQSQVVRLRANGLGWLIVSMQIRFA